MRWWDDPEASKRFLDMVDDSDPAQGVATAVLGHHGLCMSVLRPLTTQTLVDPDLIAASLAGVDLSPVVKAFDMSVGYGKKKADSLHMRAIIDTMAVCKSLSAVLPVPLAVERAAEVHGVPIHRLGPYLSTMRTIVVPPVVRADLADRQLMLWARDVYAG
jgi:hypothetical protein